MRGAVRVLVVVALAFPGLAGCEDEKPAPLPPGVEEVRIEDPTTFWSGFAEMTPTIPLPVFPKKRSRTQVFVRLPEGGQIDVVEGPEGPLLSWPAGTRADRVESFRKKGGEVWTVADVRGAVIEQVEGKPGGEHWHHTLRPVRKGFGNPPLVGYRWKADDTAARDAMIPLVEKRYRAGGGQVFPATGERLEDRVKTMRRQNTCLPCHTPMRPTATRPRPGPAARRPTDAAGWFHPQSVLAATSPIEVYRPHSMVAEQAFITVSCPGKLEVGRRTTNKGEVRYRCIDKKPSPYPMATLDIEQAMGIDDPHARKVCASRRFLHEHMTTKAREAFRARFAECGIEP